MSRANGYQVGQQLYAWQGARPYFALAEVISPPGQAPYPDQVMVRYLEAPEAGMPGTERLEAVRHLHHDSPELRAWWAARAEYARLVREAIIQTRQAGLNYDTEQRVRRLAITRERDAAYEAEKDACRRAEALNPYGLAWGKRR